MKKINGYFSSLMKAYDAKDYREGLRISREARVECPEEGVQTLFWQACMHSLMGNPDEAFAALRAGLGEGVWWSPGQLDRETDFDPIRGLAEFAEIKAECQKRFTEKQSKSEPGFLMIEPVTGMDPQRCIVLLHWMGGTAREFSAYWKPLAEESGWTLAVVQSSQVNDSSGFCWDDMDLGRKEVLERIGMMESARGIQREKLIVAGASQGARLAFEVAHEIGAPFFCVIPSFPAGYADRARERAGRGGPGVFVLGELDGANDRTRPVIDALKEAGARVAVRVMRGVGHDFPDDFTEQIRDDLEETRARVAKP